MKKTLDFINEKTNSFKPEIGIILGSGLGDFANNFPCTSIPYSEIPGFETSTVAGHAGKLLFCEIPKSEQGTVNCEQNPTYHSPLTTHVVMMQGRFHFYEGYSMEKVVFPVKVMKKLGIKTLIVTNAAGGINVDFKAGDLMLIEDHINLLGTNPLIGKNDDDLGVRFPDMSEVYKKNLRQIASDCSKELNIELKKGVYLATTGPSYETPAEIRMFRGFGADAVGMSTVPEAIVANYAGIDVLGISCISNSAAGVQDSPLTHQEVIDSTNMAGEKFKKLLLKIIDRL